MVIGLDETTMQPVHAGHQYFARKVLWGSRHVDIRSESEDGNLLLDLNKRHDTEPTPPSAGSVEASLDKRRPLREHRFRPMTMLRTLPIWSQVVGVRKDVRKILGVGEGTRDR